MANGRLKIQDHTMNCCLLVEAFGFNDLHDWGDIDHAMVQNAINELKQWQLDHRRNVALVALSEAQTIAREVVEHNGFKKILEVYNPNSYRMVAIYARVLWERREDYEKAVDSGAYKAPSRCMWYQACRQTDKIEEPINAL